MVDEPVRRGDYETASLSAIHHALRTPRRRLIIAILTHEHCNANNQPNGSCTVLTVRELAKRVVAIENETCIEHATGDPYHNVYTSFIQTHLPELDRVEAIKYDADRKRVRPGDHLVVFATVNAITAPATSILYSRVPTQDGIPQSGIAKDLFCTDPGHD